MVGALVAARTRDIVPPDHGVAVMAVTVQRVPPPVPAPVPHVSRPGQQTPVVRAGRVVRVDEPHVVVASRDAGGGTATTRPPPARARARAGAGTSSGPGARRAAGAAAMVVAVPVIDETPQVMDMVHVMPVLADPVAAMLTAAGPASPGAAGAPGPGRAAAVSQDAAGNGDPAPAAGPLVEQVASTHSPMPTPVDPVPPVPVPVVGRPAVRQQADPDPDPAGPRSSGPGRSRSCWSRS